MSAANERPAWQDTADSAAIQMAREGLLRFETADHRPLSPEEIPVPIPDDLQMILTDKGREYLARAQVGEEP
jgi:hypothetical protein